MVNNELFLSGPTPKILLMDLPVDSVPGMQLLFHQIFSPIPMIILKQEHLVVMLINGVLMLRLLDLEFEVSHLEGLLLSIVD